MPDRIELMEEDMELGVIQSRPPKSEPRVFHARSTPPVELAFVVPEDMLPGDSVCVSGPHGPLLMKVPDGSRPGQPCSVRLGPTATFKVTVPEGRGPGDLVNFEGREGQQLQVPVPDGKVPGDVFEVTPPALMVQVPEAATPGDRLVFFHPDGRELAAVVPIGTEAGQYIAVPL